MARDVIVERWWNGTWGSLARRDVWLWRTADGGWRVELSLGGLDDGVREHEDFDDEAAARVFLDRALAQGGSGWRRLDTERRESGPSVPTDGP